MRIHGSITYWASCCLAVGVLAGCGGKAESTSDGANSSGGVTGGPGITDSEIRLGVLTDASGVFAASGRPITQASQLFWKDVNANGGVCGRQVKLVVRDHGYDPQKAVVQYRDLSGDVAALQQLQGSPMAAALLPSLERDSMLSVVAGWPSSLLSKKFIMIVGTTTDLELINGLAYQLEQGAIEEGDRIGHIYFEGEYGETGLLGSKAFARDHGLKLIEQKVKATDEDMSGQIAAFRRAGVKAFAMTTGPTQMASAAGIAASQGLDVPIVGNGATWDPALLEGAAAKALKKNVFIIASTGPYPNAGALAEKARKAYGSSFPDETPKNWVMFGWAHGEVMRAALQQACDDGDLSREGIVEAARKVRGLDLQGLTAGTQDFSKVGEPSTRTVYITRPAEVPGGIAPIEGSPDGFEFDAAKNYKIASE